jgi:hypothetical protein
MYRTFDDDDDDLNSETKLHNGHDHLDPNNNNHHEIKSTINNSRECFAFAVC